MKLTIEAFRGARDPVEFSFKTGNDLTILYGANGDGKTTVSDAFDFVFHGTVGSLEGKSIDGKNKYSALVNARKKKADLCVTWEEYIAGYILFAVPKDGFYTTVEHQRMLLAQRQLHRYDAVEGHRADGFRE